MHNEAIIEEATEMPSELGEATKYVTNVLRLQQYTFFECEFKKRTLGKTFPLSKQKLLENVVALDNA